MSKIICPLRIKRKRAKPWTVSLNNVLITNPKTVSNLKKVFISSLRDQFIGLESLKAPIKLTLVYYPENRIKRDLGNHCSIQQKFVEDAAVQYGLIEDDNYSVITNVEHKIAPIDKLNPRCEAIFEEIR